MILGLLVVSTILWTLGEVPLATSRGAYLAEHTPVISGPASSPSANYAGTPGSRT